MSDYLTMEFGHRGHRIRVSRDDDPDEWLGDFDTVFNVLIDGAKTVVPGIWEAYQMAGEKGVELVLKAYLDISPVPHNER